ncbi:MAG: TonB family protein [Deltaproteobacteria bacterium]|nr:TonB family protein [Deltaproteobacteria bacterium]
MSRAEARSTAGPEPDWRLQIELRWGERVLDVRQLAPGARSLRIGEGEEADLFVPADRLPGPLFTAARLIPTADGEPPELRLCVPPKGLLCLQLEDGRTVDLDEAAALSSADPGSPSFPGRQIAVQIKERGRSRAEAWPSTSSIDFGPATPSCAARWCIRDADQPGCRTLIVPPGASARLSLGGLELELRLVRKPDAVRTPWLDRIETRYPNVLAVVAAAFLALLATFHLRPASVAASERELSRVPDRYVQFFLDRHRAEPVDLSFRRTLAAELEPKFRAQAARHRGAEGKAGKRGQPDIGRRRAVRGQGDRHELGSRGLLAALRASGEPEGLGLDTESLGSDLESALGGLRGPPGESGGVGGQGLRGPGPGGGGVSVTIGIGDLDTRGWMAGDPDYRRAPRRQHRGRPEREVAIHTGQLEIVGPLSRETIRRIIRSHRDQIRYCYGQALTREPHLSGKLVVRFTVEGDGRVAGVGLQHSTLGRSDMERCILDRVRTWVFPAPRGGGTVSVRYPFLFRAPGKK